MYAINVFYTKNAQINEHIRHILDLSKTGHYAGNHEFNVYRQELRQVSFLDENSAQLKVHTYDKFVHYNALRLKLECDLEKRIAVIDSYLYDNKIGKRCKEFYRQQKQALKSALIESNLAKQHVLKLQSELCPQKDDDDDDDDDDSEDSSSCDWTNWWPNFDYFG